MLLFDQTVIGQEVKIHSVHPVRHQIQISDINDVVGNPEIDVAESSLGKRWKSGSLSPSNPLLRLKPERER